jgi:hypothetical protein
MKRKKIHDTWLTSTVGINGLYYKSQICCSYLAHQSNSNGMGKRTMKGMGLSLIWFRNHSREFISVSTSETVDENHQSG